jgi:hypothetical protein
MILHMATKSLAMAKVAAQESLESMVYNVKITE